MKYLIYCRKSSEQEDRQALSIPSQVEELTAIVDKLHLNMADKPLTEAKSAKHVGREQFNLLIARIQAGEADAILVWHPDRLSRNPQDMATIICLMDAGQLKEVLTPTQKFINNPMDKFMLGFLMLQAKLENDSKGVNVKRGLRSKAKNGWFPGSWAKAGYMWDKTAERGNKTILKDPIRFPLIRKAWELMITGAYTPPQILKKLNDEWGYTTPQRKSIGGGKMQRSTIYKIFTDPFYFGEYEFIDEDNTVVRKTGKHEAMINSDEFDRVQMLLGRKGRPRPKTHSFPFTGIIRCGECDAMITAEEKWQIICPSCKNKFSSNNKDACPKCQTLIEAMVKPTLLHYQYYHCTKRKNPNCSQKSIKIEDLEKQLEALLGKIEISERFKDWAIKYLNELNEQEKEDRNAVIANLQENHKACVQKLDNLIKLKISPSNSDGGLISDQEFKQQKASLLAERKAIEDRMQRQGVRIENWVEMAEKAFNFACHARYWFMNGDIHTKKEIVTALGQNLTLFDKTLRVDLEKPLCFIEDARKETDKIIGMLEPKEKVDITPQLEALWAENLTMLPG